MTEQPPGQNTGQTPGQTPGQPPGPHPATPGPHPVYTHRFGDHEHTSAVPRYGDPAYGGTQTTVLPPPPPGGWAQPKQPERRPRSRTAWVLLAALLVGTGGGVAGAAAYEAANGDDAGSTRTAGETLRTGSTADSDAVTPKGSVEKVAEGVLPSVVKINVAGEEGQGSGSGIILSSDGEILTNNHVAEVAENGGQMSVSFNDGSTAAATIVGTDPVTDLAVIKAQGVSGLTPAKIGNSDALDVGEEVVAIGSPFGLEATVTSGIVSSLNRPVSVGEASSPSGGDTTYPAIQTDAAINPGNSGGPLVNMAGQVIGINSSIRTSSTGLSDEQGGSIGLGFAIPISKVLPIVEQLRGGDTPTHARLGVTVSDEPTKSGMLDGAGIESIEDGSAAAAAGLESGDVVTKVDDEPITSVESLVATIRGYRPGDEVTLTVRRGDETLTLKATLDSDASSNDG